MVKTVYLHIGSHKTGTTSIQHFLLHNRTLINKVGWEYPEIELAESAHHKIAGQLVKDAKAGIFENNLEPSIDFSQLQRWRSLKEFINHTEFENIIISSENFWWLARPSVLKTFFNGFRVVVVLYIRRQDVYLESLYQQFVKDAPSRLSQKIGPWVKGVLSGKRFHDYSAVIDKWALAFGSENILVGEFDEAIKLGLENHFIEMIGLDQKAGFDYKKQETSWLQKQKMSLDARCVEFLRLNNAIKMTSKEHNSILRKVMKTSDNLKASGDWQKNIMPLELRHTVMNDIMESNEKVRRNYFPHKDQLFSEISEQDVPKLILINKVVKHYIRQCKREGLLK